MSKAEKKAQEAAAQETPTAPEAQAPEAQASEQQALATSSMKFADEVTETAADSPTIVERTIDGELKKFKIRGKRFHYNGIDYTDVELALPDNAHIIDMWIANKSAVLQEYAD